MAVAAAMTLLDRLLDAVPTKISYAMRAELPVSEGAFHFSVIVPNPATTLVNIPARRRGSMSTVIQIDLPRPFISRLARPRSANDGIRHNLIY